MLNKSRAFIPALDKNSLSNYNTEILADVFEKQLTCAVKLKPQVKLDLVAAKNILAALPDGFIKIKEKEV